MAAMAKHRKNKSARKNGSAPTKTRPKHRRISRNSQIFPRLWFQVLSVFIIISLCLLWWVNQTDSVFKANSNAAAGTSKSRSGKKGTFEVIDVLPHDPTAFTYFTSGLSL